MPSLLLFFFQHRPCHKTDRQAFVFSSIYLLICKVFAKPLCTCKRIGRLFHYSDTLERKGKENTCNLWKEGTFFADEEIHLDLGLPKQMEFYLSLGFTLRCMLWRRREEEIIVWCRETNFNIHPVPVLYAEEHQPRFLRISFRVRVGSSFSICASASLAMSI